MHFKTLQDPKFDIEFSIFSHNQGRQKARHIALKNLPFIKHKVSFFIWLFGCTKRHYKQNLRGNTEQPS